MKKLGCVPYLNARPLVAYFDEDITGYEVTYDTPSRLAASLRLGELDVALVSSYELFLRPNLMMVPDISISTMGPVVSVRLFSKVPFSEIETLALDQSSLTSTHLAQVLLAELFDCSPIVSSEAPDQDEMLSGNDACVLIGDAGMSAGDKGLHVLDLGAAWTELTGLPFVWAAWIGEDVAPEVVNALTLAKSWGEKRLVSLAVAHAAKLGWSDSGPSIRYLTEIMDYSLSTKHIEGLELFQAMCLKQGLLEHQYPVRLARQVETIEG